MFSDSIIANVQFLGHPVCISLAVLKLTSPRINWPRIG